MLVALPTNAAGPLCMTSVAPNPSITAAVCGKSWVWVGICGVGGLLALRVYVKHSHQCVQGNSGPVRLYVLWVGCVWGVHWGLLRQACLACIPV